MSPRAHEAHLTGDAQLDGRPFHRDGLLRRLGPFALVAVLAEASLALPPGPSSAIDAVCSVALLALCAIGCLLPWERYREGWEVLIPLVYIGSVLALSMAAGGSSSGVGIVILVPLVWTSLYHRPLQSAVVVLAVVLYQLISSLVPVEMTGAVLARRLTFWLALAWLTSFATYQLRSQIASMLEQRQALIEARESALEDMTRSVATLEARDVESQTLIDLGEGLQASANMAEAYAALERTGALLFEGGALSLLNPEHGYLETTLSWGPTSLRGGVFAVDECWALRRGRVHVSDEPSDACSHLVDTDFLRSICVPMIAQNETLGVFHVFAQPGAAPEVETSRQWQNTIRLALAIGEHVGMSMANFRLRDTLRDQSIRDPLTNLFNRRYLEVTFARELARAARDTTEVSIMLIDVDHFKEFNDTHGHDVGDHLLRAFADLLFTLFRDEDIPCRFGGEEFTLILFGSSLEETERRAKELQARVATLVVNPGAEGVAAPPPPTLSIGLATFPQHGASADALIHAADLALYVAKSTGRNAIRRAGEPTDASTVVDANLDYA